MKKNFRPAFSFLAVLLVFALVTACGGGGSSSRGPDVQPSENTPPVADAGADQETVESSEVTLDGSGSSDADGDELTYSWRLVSPASGAVLSDPTAVRPTFRADQVGTVIVELTVSDGVSSSIADSVTITVLPLPNLQPQVASWPYNLSSVTEETDSDGNGEIDSTFITTYSYGPDGRVTGSQKIKGGTQEVLEAETFIYREDGLLNKTTMVRPVGQYSRTYQYNENGSLVSAVASGIVANVFSYQYDANGRLSKITSENHESNFQYDGELLTGTVTVDANHRIWSYIFEGDRLVSEEYTLNNVGPMVKIHSYENGVLTGLDRDIDYQKDGVAEAREATHLSYDPNGNLQKAEYTYSDLVTGKTRYKNIYFSFTSNGMPTTDFAYAYPLYGAKKEPLVPRIVKNYFVD